jgi:hippurate hydrolase
VFDPGPVTASEDVGVLADAAGAPCVYWLLGGADPAPFATTATRGDTATVVAGLSSNHSSRYAPVIEPTVETGVRALVAAVHTWLPAT